jgi:calcineurin-like phosphoesterase family protein
MSKIFVCSDLHFNHDRSFVYSARGFNSVEEMNEAIIERHNSKVSPEDEVYICGDLCLGGCVEGITARNQTLIERLNGRIHIILGNHDTPARIEMYRMCKNVVEVVYATMIHYRGYHFYLSHFPTLTANLEKETLKQCTICLFGHTHSKERFFNDMPFMYNIAMDAHNCYPVLLDDAIEEMKNKVKECKEQL